MQSPAIQVDGLSKRYRIGERHPYLVVRDVIGDLVRAPMRILMNGLKRESPPTTDTRRWLWALDNVSFEVQPGEVVGIVGRNGAGKSTLLKILTRITHPTRGQAILRGRVGSLLEVGTGFHPELTGHENIYFNGAVLGMRKHEIQSRFDAIVDFSGVERFLDTPIKHYSSGMKVRLAFSVAAYLNPEILLVDEVLSVGDAEFQARSLGKMRDVTQAGRTVLFVSHDMSAVNQLCSRVIWLDDGRIRLSGPAETVVSEYLTRSADFGGEFSSEEGIANVGEQNFRLHRIRVFNHRGEVSSTVDTSHAFEIEITYALRRPEPDARIGIQLSTADGVLVMESYDTDDIALDPQRAPGTYVSKCSVPANLLNAKRYVLGINAGIPNRRNMCRKEGLIHIDVSDLRRGSLSIPRRGLVKPSLEWRETQVDAASRFA